MTKQIKIVLTEQELKLLSQSASQQCRRPHDQARFLLLTGLGLMNGQQQPNEKSDDQASVGRSVALVEVNP